MSTNVLSIADFGARPGAKCTAAIQAAIDAAAQGGGTVYVPPGVFTTGTLVLKSGVTLHVDPAATLLGSPDLADYPEFPANMHEEGRHFLIFAEDAHDIAITGGGVLDGNGPAFWKKPEPPYGTWWGALKPRVLPMLEFRRIRRLRLENIRIQNSPGWTVHPFCCDDVTFRGVRVSNHMFGPNTDGFDINGCRDVFISDCHLMCGDDAIIIKATPHARSTERVVITNCICYSNCIGIGIGQETESDIRQVSISNCVIYKSHRMVTIGIWNGGTVEDIAVSNITGDTLAHYCLARPIQMEIKQSYHLPQTRPLGRIRNVSISNFVCRTQGRILLTAQEGSAIEDVTLRDIRMQYVALEDAEALSPTDGRQGSNQYANMNVEARKQNAAVVLENVRGLDLSGLSVRWPEPGAKSTAKAGPGTDGKIPTRVDPPYAAVWARHVSGRIHAPLAGPSQPAVPAIIASQCELT